MEDVRKELKDKGQPQYTKRIVIKHLTSSYKESPEESFSIERLSIKKEDHSVQKVEESCVDSSICVAKDFVYPGTDNRAATMKNTAGFIHLELYNRYQVLSDDDCATDIVEKYNASCTKEG